MGEDRRYDVIVIGTGTAGQTAAGKLNKAGKDVAIVDNRPFGGTCALRGCQPKKYFVVNTQLVKETEDLVGFGISKPAVTDWSALQRFKSQFTDPIPESTAKGLEKKGIDTYNGSAVFKEKDRICLEESGICLRAPAIIIATGSRSRDLPIPGIEHAITSDDFLNLEQLPDTMVCIGGGYISLEFASAAGLSGTDVHILERGSRILPAFPASLVDVIQEVSEKHRVHMHTDIEVTGITKKGNGYLVQTASHGDYPADLVLSAVGRVPDIDQLGLDEVGIEYAAKGITVDEYMESSVKGIYAIGDCAATLMLSPIADLEAGVVSDNILEAGSKRISYDAVPTVVFSYPPMASVGISAQQARDGDLDVRINTGDGARWPNYRRIKAEKFYYEIVIDKKSDKILGAHLAGSQAGELINLFALAIRHEIPASSLSALPWAYPTYVSDIKYMV
jgi:glutathione reductase (NADPH)